MAIWFKMKISVIDPSQFHSKTALSCLGENILRSGANMAELQKLQTKSMLLKRSLVHITISIDIFKRFVWSTTRQLLRSAATWRPVLSYTLTMLKCTKMGQCEFSLTTCPFIAPHFHE